MFSIQATIFILTSNIESLVTGKLVHWENKLQEILQHSKCIMTLHSQNITLTLYRCMLNTWNIWFFRKNIERCYLCSKAYRNVEKYFIILNNWGQHECMCRNKIWQEMFEAEEKKKRSICLNFITLDSLWNCAIRLTRAAIYFLWSDCRTGN